VPKDQYDSAVAAARRANDQLEKSQSALQSLRVENENVRSELTARDAALATKDKLIQELTDGNAVLDLALKELTDKYRTAVAAAGARPLGKVTILPPPMDTALKALAEGNPNLMDYVSEYGMIKLKSDLTFDKGSAQVKADAEKALTKLAEVVNTAEARKYHVYAAGHTDDIPLSNPATIARHGSNWGLSLHRAGGVVKVLAMAGVEQVRLGAAGFSKYHPVAPNQPGNKGNPLNRRVEIWIVPPERLLATNVQPAPEPGK
ncbi:MAG: OmpA family protein, partial [Planctomycetota bacterium]|jgi:chemotaxis protein MotB